MSWIFPIFHPWKVLIHYIWLVSPGEYDPAEIHNAGQLRRHMVRNAKMRRNLTNFSLGMKIYLTRFSWPGWCVSAHGLADGELLHVPLLPAGCCYAGTGDNSADTFWKLCVGWIPWKHSSCSRWLSRWTTMWRCSTVRWKPNTTHPHLIMCTLRHVQCFNYIQCTTHVAYYL